MVRIRHYDPVATMSDGPVEVFQTQWQLYRLNGHARVTTSNIHEPERLNGIVD
jgi:hypothetical protein